MVAPLGVDCTELFQVNTLNLIHSETAVHKTNNKRILQISELPNPSAGILTSVYSNLCYSCSSFVFRAMSECVNIKAYFSSIFRFFKYFQIHANLKNMVD